MLRDLAYPLIEPPYERGGGYSVIVGWRCQLWPWPYPDRSAYASRLFTTAYRSQTARYNRLIEDIRNDVMRSIHSSARRAMSSRWIASARRRWPMSRT